PPSSLSLLLLLPPHLSSSSLKILNRKLKSKHFSTKRFKTFSFW
ncbi:hypothetical protein LINPERPRIM_LOCUS40840, partial [Linum perenne]